MKLEKALENMSLRDVAGSSTNYTDQHLCEILKNMLKDAGTIGGRKNAAIALFGIIYGEFINSENKAKLLDVTAQFGVRRSNENQLNNGLCVYRFLKNNPAINIFDVLEKTSVSVNELSQQLENELKSAERGTKEARVIIFGIKNSKNIPESNSERKIIYGDGGLIALGCHIIDFIEAFPQYKTLKPNSFQEDEKNMSQNINLNTILYGPPGTGKTYNTVLYAVAICDGNKSLDDLKEEAKSKDGYNKIIDRYNELIDQGRIAFTTFHQSYGYEEFVEGIKPEMDEKKQLYYDVKAGCFKEFCDNASIKLVDKDSTISSNITVWKTTIQKSVIKDCFENNRVRIGWDLEDVGANGFVNDMKTGDLILTTDGSRTKINGIAIIKSEAYTLEGESDTTTRDVDWIATDINLDISEFNNGKMLHRMTVARVPNVDAIKILSIKENFSTLNVEKNEDPYVFIIDEINRGNVSKIFGELITLIEDSKRSGRKEAMEVVLPYSGDRFSVPENVYILGTMNTADRSLALMDTALRRRFDFVEMMPDTSIFEGIEVDGISIKSLLEKINKRIEFLYDREHTIGHAYFKELLDKENRNIETLRKIFIKKIIPLLQEYFYDDYERIRLVLGDNRADINDEYFIQECDDMDKLFFGNADIDRESKTYLVNKDIEKFSTERFKKIYE